MTLVDKTPILTTLLLEAANVGQITRMWREGTAEGQSLSAWLLVCGALCLWQNFFWRTMPKGSARTYSLVGTAIGITMNLTVVLTVIYFRYWT